MLKNTEKTTSEITSQIIDSLKSIITTPNQTPLHEPFFGGSERELLSECIDSGFVSSIGPFVDLFEKTLATYTGAKHVIAVVNGTSALHICLLMCGVNKGDEVIVPDMTFVATANSVVYCNATPHFADISKKTLCLDPEKLHEYLKDIVVRGPNGTSRNKITGNRIKAVVAVHSFGHPAELDKLLNICEEFQLDLIEDAAESLGTLFNNRHTGTFGKLGALSFNGNKIITSGGGGAILTDDPDLAKKIKHVTTTAKTPHPWRFFHDQVAFNYRMPNINAALGCAQMKQLPQFIKLKRKLAHTYISLFKEIDEVEIFQEQPFAQSNYWLNVLLLAPQLKDKKEDIISACSQLGIGLRPAWELMHTLPMFKNCPCMDSSNAEEITSRLINLPSSVALMNNL